MNLHCNYINCININAQPSTQQLTPQISPCPHCKKVFYCSDSCRFGDWFHNNTSFK